MVSPQSPGFYSFQSINNWSSRPLLQEFFARIFQIVSATGQVDNMALMCGSSS
jgi:hypothetical protein